MNLLPAFTPTSIDIADLFTRPLPITSHHRYTQLVIGDDPITPTSLPASATPTTLVVPTPSVASTATVDSVAVATTTSASTSVPSLHPNLTLPIVLDTGSSIARTPFASDFALAITQAPYGLFRSTASLVSDSKIHSVVSKANTKVTSVASTPVDPYTLITGEDIASIASDLSSPDTTVNSNSGHSFDLREFGTATLTFIYSKSTLDLLHIFVEPTQIDWLHWTPLPRLILPESYFHIFGLDYLQAFTLFHLIPIWIYSLLHFGLE